jgi:hypothetical protein
MLRVAATLKIKVDIRVEALDLVISMAAIPLVTDCEPAYRQGTSQRASTGVCRISLSPPSSRVITPGMHICTLYVQTRQSARSERDSFAVCWQLACIFRLTAWSHSPEMTLATQQRARSSCWLTVVGVLPWLWVGAHSKTKRSVLSVGTHFLLPLLTRNERLPR